jgi:hypothetical protein
MPPQFDWLDYRGADAIGSVIGLWFRFCMSLLRALFRLVIGTTTAVRHSPVLVQKSESFAASNASLRTEPSFFGRVRKTAISTLVTVGVWSAITWKPIWIAAGPTGDKILTVVLLFVSAAWPISLVWIWFSKPRSTKADRKARPSPYSRSNRANAA